MASSYYSDDAVLGMAVKCSPITQAELDDAESFDAMVDDTTVELKAPQKEDREGVARTKVIEIEGDGPVIFDSRVLSMHRLLWADGAMEVSGTTKKATLAVFKINMESYTKSSGEGKDKAVKMARIQVEFHSSDPDADIAGDRRPVVVGWEPFPTSQRSNETTAERTSDRSWRANVQGGMAQASATLERGGSNSRAWQQRYFDMNQSRPVVVSEPAAAGTSTSKNFNGVVWTLQQNSLAREGVVPELLVYMLVTRQDDSEYAVRITVDVYTSVKFLGTQHHAHKAVVRVPPKEPSRTTPAVRYLEGEKMWQRLDVDHFERLLSPGINNGLVLPWEVEEGVGTNDAKSGAVETNPAAGTKHGKDPENEAAKGEDANTSNGVEGADAAKAAPSATLTEAVRAPVAQSRQDAAPPLADKDVMDALRRLCEGGDKLDKIDKIDKLDKLDMLDMEDDLPTRIAVLESRMEAMEYRMARQAGVIRALLKHRG